MTRTYWIAALLLVLASAPGLETAGAADSRRAYFRDGFNGPRINLEKWRHWWGKADVHRGQASLASTPPRSWDETHSSLLTTRKSWRNYVLRFQTQTVKPLRVNDPPKVWEVGWVMFRFRDLENYYWFMLKPNGYELGKKQGSDRQIFLVTGGSPSLQTGRTYRITISARGPRIGVWVDGHRIIDYTDPDPLLRGAVGLYEEDAHVHFDQVRVLRPRA